MLNLSNLKTNLIQIYSLTVKDLKLSTRYKLEFLVECITPLLGLFFPYIIFNTLFKIKDNIFGGYYSKENFLLFLLLGNCVTVLIFLFWYYQDLFNDEKTWKTLNAIMIAPINKVNILFSYLIAGIISKGIPIIFIFILCFILYPISLPFLLLSIIILFCISLTFASMGFILGVFEIVNEDVSASLSIGISFIALVSCLYYPIDIFPKEIHFIIKLNPLYYYFDLFRLIWWAGINYEEALSFITIYHFIVIATFTVISPVFASYLFLKVYSKYGISGY